MIERFQVNQLRYLDPNGGGFAFNQEIQLDSDAPFRLSGIAVYPLGGLDAGGNSGQFAGGVAIRYTRPDRMWVQRHLIPGNSLNPANLLRQFDNPVGQGGNYVLWSPISPNSIYPPGGTILFDIQTQPNIGPIAVLIVLIGTKIYRDGAVWTGSYPANYRALPYMGYGVQVSGAKLPLLNQPMPIRPDADFVWQASTYSDFGGGVAILNLNPAPESNQGSLTFTAAPGSAGNSVTIEVTFAGNNTPLSVNVAGSAITIELATNGLGAPTSSVSDVIAAYNATPAAVALAAISGSGLGLASPVNNVAQNLAGGSAATSNELIDLGVRIKDFAGKYYMNDFIPAALLFGFGAPQLPGLPYPEIYCPKNEALYFDFAWLSSPVNATSPSSNIATITLKGMKVYGS